MLCTRFQSRIRVKALNGRSVLYLFAKKTWIDAFKLQISHTYLNLFDNNTYWMFSFCKPLSEKLCALSVINRKASSAYLKITPKRKAKILLEKQKKQTNVLVHEFPTHYSCQSPPF